jgi:hypothetical protein
MPFRDNTIINTYQAAAAAGGDFILFPNLAPELQLMIWKEAAMHGRVVIVDHAFKKKDRASRKNIIEQYPGMLGACHQSRELVKSSYRSVFQEPGVSYRWEYAGRKTYGDLYNVAMTLFNIASEAPEDYQTLVRTLNAYMNRHPEQTNIFANFANLVQKHKGNHGTVMPAFFNPDVDIIYIRRDIGNQGQGIQNFRRGLWIPNKTMGAAKIQKLAIELDRLKCCAVESRFEEERDIRLWPSCTPFRQLSGLKEFNLVLLEDREIITFTVDDTGLLRGCEWYFSLDVKSKEFKEDIGNYWLNVTWRVTLAPQKGYNLMQLAHRWRPQNETWEWQKQEICKRDRDVEEEWHDTIRVPTFDYPQWLKGEDKGRKKNERKMKLVPNGDGKSYWGVSRKEIF